MPQSITTSHIISSAAPDLRSSTAGVCRDQKTQTYLVYKATSPSGKAYVGITKRGFSVRQIEHRYLARSGKNRYFAAALRKYGPAMSWEVLEVNIATLDEANERERYHILLHRSHEREHGYNLTLGGDGVVASVETKAKMSASAKARGVSEKQLANLEKGRGDAWRGRKHSLETRQKMSAVKIGRQISEETRQKMSEAHRGRKKTEEHKRKIGDANKGRVISFEHREILRMANAHPLLSSTGEPFLSATHAAEVLGVRCDSLWRVVRHNKTCRGLSFRAISMAEYDEAVSKWNVLPVLERPRINAKHDPSPQQIRRGDGTLYKSMTQAAKCNAIPLSSLAKALKHGTSVKGFTFTRTESQIEKEL